MRSEIYEVVGGNGPASGAWQVAHNGKAGMDYSTKEAAFEAAVAAASLAIRDGAEVSIVVQGSAEAGRPTRDLADLT
ncbi:DUF2188 domain-containing protein [Ancylobacter sp. 6x-1]|uniref:DUF2188 domain-containing protein n=1 Tax=Ancylobacter crimeensis TaxID=2579147 RepID=A0ABT0DAK5_9HYPH|nr:DUF2188 domain-containing protein [Ancylobacter crimeensis]MCK0196944.1 DUF2188 domain-containing protein [Ancylobacter crimeensis]